MKDFDVNKTSYAGGSSMTALMEKARDLSKATSEENADKACEKSEDAEAGEDADK